LDQSGGSLRRAIDDGDFLGGEAVGLGDGRFVAFLDWSNLGDWTNLAARYAAPSTMAISSGVRP